MGNDGELPETSSPALGLRSLIPRPHESEVVWDS